VFGYSACTETTLTIAPPCASMLGMTARVVRTAEISGDECDRAVRAGVSRLDPRNSGVALATYRGYLTPGKWVEAQQVDYRSSIHDHP